MANSIAEAPAGATKAPARPKTVAAGREPEPIPQWLVLGLQHTRQLCDLLYTLVNADAKAQGLIQDLVESAEAHLHGIVSDESCVDVTADGALYCQIAPVVVMLEAAWYAAEHGPLDYPPPLHEAVIPSAISYAKGIAHALKEAPSTDRFLALAQPRTVAGARPHRDRPRPPIRRVGSEDLHEMLLTAESLGHVLYAEVVEPSSGINDPNDPAGWQQMEIALVVALQTQIANIRAAVEGGAR